MARPFFEEGRIRLRLYIIASLWHRVGVDALPILFRRVARGEPLLR